MQLIYPWVRHPFYCEHLWMRIALQADGSIEPCGCAVSEDPPVAFRPGGLHAAWNNEPFARSRRYLWERMHGAECRVPDATGVFDVCANCPVAPGQRFQTKREYYENLLHAARRGGKHRRRKLENLARLIAEARRGEARLTSYPVWATIDPANRCNLRCPECLVGRGEITQPARFMKPEVFEAILEELGPALIFLELYRYGEPLLNPNLPAMIERAAREYGIATRISTNFSMPLSDEKLKALVECGLDQLVIAADDVEQSNYEQYRRGGKIEVVRDNLRRLAAFRRATRVRRPRILWQALRFRFNQSRAQEIAREARAWGADRFAMLPAYISSRNPQLIPEEGGRRGRSASADRPRPIVAARCEPAGFVPGAAFRLTVTLRNVLKWARLPAEADGEAHPIRIGVRMVDAAGERLGDLGRIRIDRELARGEEAEFSAMLRWPEDPAVANRLDALVIDLVAEFRYWFEDQLDIQTAPLRLSVKTTRVATPAAALG